MKLYDISQEVMGCNVYPGDPAPKAKVLQRTERGDVCNLTAFSMCAHNGTHVDAPFHFYGDGKTVGELPLEHYIGPAYVAPYEGELTRADAEKILADAEAKNHEAKKRILLKGRAVVTLEAAEVFFSGGLVLLGVESQTVGPEDAPMAVHLALLKGDIVLLEGVRLSHVPSGVYLLHAAPLHLAGFDGAPCRATLMEVKS